MAVGGALGGLGGGTQVMRESMAARGTVDGANDITAQERSEAPRSDFAPVEGNYTTEGESEAQAPESEAGEQNKTASTEETENTAIDDNPTTHTPEQMRIIEEYKNAVDENLVNFIETSIENKGSNKGRYTLKPVSDRAASDILSLTGIDTTGFKTVIEQRIAEHIVDRHGEKGQANQTMRDINDIGRMQYVIDNYDHLEFGGKTRAYTTVRDNGKQNLADTVRYLKAVDGTYYVVEAVPNTKAKTAFIVSAYLENNSGKKQPIHAQRSLMSTSENADALFPAKSTIPQPAESRQEAICTLDKREHEDALTVKDSISEQMILRLRRLRLHCMRQLTQELRTERLILIFS